MATDQALTITSADTPQAALSALPHNIEAEQALLGSLLYDNYAFEAVGDILQSEHFSEGVHTQIYDAIRRLIERNQVADPVTLKDYFKSQGTLEDIGGVSYLAKLAQAVISTTSAKDYALLIHDLYLRRQLIHLSQDLSSSSATIDIDVSAKKLIEQTEQHLFDLATVGQMDRGFVDFDRALRASIEIADNARRAEGKLVGVTTGLADIDRALGGLHPSDLLILAGRPSMGKTALATNMAFNAAKHALKANKDKSTIAFFSLEMSAEQLAGRILSAESEVTSDLIRRGDLDDQSFERFREVQTNLMKLPLYIDDTPALTIASLRTRCRRLARQKGLALIVIDYLQLLSGSGRRSENRVQELSEITRGLKALAKELNVPVLALSQLSRSVEQRDDKRPQLADLRESGSIEQDADVVMFVYRHAYYLERKKPDPGSKNYAEEEAKWNDMMHEVHNVAEVIVAKQRHGPIGTHRLFFDSRLTKFGNLKHEDSLRITQKLNAA